MARAKTIIEGEVLNIFKSLPQNKKAEVVDFIQFLGSRFEGEKKRSVARAVAAVKGTYGSMRLSKKTLKFIAENKDIEYDS
ncbi:MAG: hypothetical protein M0024_07310 [Nitrospiraceae bacterium]|nr:hypothetical protein [Nitrospiraceae bacterium]